jgi:hypothetical protein
MSREAPAMNRLAFIERRLKTLACSEADHGVHNPEYMRLLCLYYRLQSRLDRAVTA